MVKKSSAEHVNPITRANYDTKQNSAASSDDDAYDPLTALANMISSNDTLGASASGDELERGLEAELFPLEVAGIETGSEVNPLKGDSGRGDRDQESDRAGVSSGNGTETPVAAIAEEPSYAQSVRRSFEELDSAFSKYPQDTEDAGSESLESIDSSHQTSESGVGEVATVAALVDFGAIEPDAMAGDRIEIAKDPTLDETIPPLIEPDTFNPETGPLEADGGFSLEAEIAAELEQHLHSEQALATDHEIATSHPETSPDVVDFPVAAETGNRDNHQSDLEPLLAFDDGLPADPLVDDGFEQEFDAALADEFEAALAVDAVEMSGESEAVATAHQEDQAVNSKTREFSSVETITAPTTALETHVLPAVRTPFDDQVNDALADLQSTEHSRDSQLGWTGELADELQQIMEPEAAQSDLPVDETFDAAPFNQSTADEFARDDANGDGSTDRVNLRAFEDEFAQSNEFHSSMSLDEHPPVGISNTPNAAGEESGRQGGWLVALVVIGLAVVAGGGALGWGYIDGQTSVDAPVKTIMASTDPVKIQPKDPGGKTILNQDQVVFEKVAGKNENAPVQKSLKTGEEKPVKVNTATTSRAAPLAGQAGAIIKTAAKSAARVTPDDKSLSRTQHATINPRRVRTVVVRPDGSIIAGPAAAKSATKLNNRLAGADGRATALKGAVEKVGAAVVKTKSVKDAVTGTLVTGTIGAENQPLIAAIQPAQQSTNGTERIAVPSKNPQLQSVVKTSAVVKTKAPVAAKPKSVTKKARGKPAAKVAALKKPPKAAKKPARKATPKAVKTASLGNYVMQISSQRTAQDAQASYNRLAQRFASVLGGRGVDIRRFKIKDKGIFYRVRVPAGDKRQAINLCQRYKKAGGSCFVSR